MPASSWTRTVRLTACTLGACLLVLLLVASASYSYLLALRPPRTSQQSPLFQGVRYVRQALNVPRPLMVHIIEVDLATPGLEFFVTPGDDSRGMELKAQTTSQFLARHGLQVAINGSFFSPFYSKTVWDYYPKDGEPVNAIGWAVAEGEIYSDDSPRLPALCVVEGTPIIRTGGCPPGTTSALAGNRLLVHEGQSVFADAERSGGEFAPRTAVALNASRSLLWLVVVDGRQQGYSDGMTLPELAAFLVDLGSEEALNLDGGGSSTLAVEGSNGPRILNTPIHTRIPMRQRPVANHFGIYAEPLLDGNTGRDGL